MARHGYAEFNPLLTEEQANGLVKLCERFGSYGMYSEEPTFGIGEGLPARWDAARNFIRTGGRFGRTEEGLEKLAARTNYFRETYAYGQDPKIDGVEPFLWHEGFIAAAKKLHGATVIEPAIVYANLLVPGQELAVHTDVPEFRGVNRMKHPQWLIVAMHHSGLFDRWRLPIATAVSWFHDSEGGEFAFYPDGPDAEPVAHPVHYNTALLLDTDSVFHGVDRVAETDEPVDRLRPGMRLRFEGNRRWVVVDGDRVVTRYDWKDLRFSVSWKAYCFRDEEERRLWREEKEALTEEAVVNRLVEDLRERGVIQGERPPDRDLVEVIIDEYIRFPEPRPEAA